MHFRSTYGATLNGLHRAAGAVSTAMTVYHAGKTALAVGRAALPYLAMVA